MMHGHEKSDHAIVAVKPANKAEEPSAARPAGEPHAAEPAEPRAGPRGMRTSKARAGRSVGKACHKRWNAYGKSQGKGRRRGSPRFSTISAPTCSKRRSSNLKRMPRRAWIG